MPVKRPLSSSLVAMLIEMKDYLSAAEVVSGSNDTFALYSRKLNDTIGRAQEIPAGVPFLDLKRIIDTAREEINEHRDWQEQVLKDLPKKDDETGATGPLRQAFTSAATERNKLLQEIMTAHDKYLKAQAGAFKLGE